MNRFFSKAKSKDSNHIDSITPETPVEPNVSKLSAKKTRKWRKGPPEPKSELDLSTALPSTDNFRTSLIMPNLSARFSMLREQDDPNSILGKASDDSVLQPKRQSRLVDFGFTANKMPDIVEDSLFNGLVLPPFATSRQDSMCSGDGYGTDDDSTHIMSRARPGEGNVMFGGRQKIYRIPTSGATSTRSLGRALYEDDVSLSAFQKHREEKRGKGSLEREQGDADLDPDNGGRSPSFRGYNRDRETISSTTSASEPSIAPSTAATSINSQGIRSASPASRTASIDRSNTKTRRLYENGLDQHMHEQQTSALTRLNSIQKQRNLSPMGTTPYVLQATTRSNPSEESSRAASPSSRTTSPLPSETNAQPTMSSFTKKANSTASSPTPPFSSSPPLSPPVSDKAHLGVIALPIEPKDYGKATAMGTFNKPKRFDEQQYLQRQMQMRQVKDSPMRVKHSPLRTDRSASQKMEQTQPSPNVRQRSVLANSSKRSLKNAFEFFQNAANKLQADQANIDKPPAPSDAYGTFFSNITGSDSEEDQEEKSTHRTSSETYRLPRSPRPSVQEKVAGPSPIAKSTAQSTSQSPKEISPNPPYPADDAPSALGTKTGGLSGLVRQHLRNTSAQSSVQGSPSPGHPTRDDSQSTFSTLSSVQTLSRATSRVHNASPDHVQDADLHDSQHKHSVEQDLWRSHHREASTETQAEREAFANEVAQRQKAIQEALKTKVDGDSRSSSPVLGSLTGNQLFDGALRPFGLLRAKSSKENVTPRSKAPLRTLKMSAFGKDSASDSNVALVDDDDTPDAAELWGRESSKHVRERSVSATTNSSQSRSYQNSEYEFQSRNDRQRQPGSSEETREGKFRALHSSSRTSERNHPGSATSSTRSRSRGAGHRDTSGKSTPDAVVRPPDLPSSQPRALKPLESTSPAPSAMLSHSNLSSANAKIISATSPQPLQTDISNKSDSSSRSPPVTPRSVEPTPPPSSLSRPTTASSGMNGMFSQQSAWQYGQHRKRSIRKSDISEPVFISATCTMEVVDLPPGASLKNGQDEVVGSAKMPPVPPFNPQRKALFAKADRTDNGLEFLSSKRYTPAPPPPSRSVSDEGANASAKARQRLGIMGGVEVQEVEGWRAARARQASLSGMI